MFQFTRGKVEFANFELGGIFMRTLIKQQFRTILFTLVFALGAAGITACGVVDDIGTESDRATWDEFDWNEKDWH